MCTDSGTQTTRGKHRLVAIEETTTNDHKPDRRLEFQLYELWTFLT